MDANKLCRMQRAQAEVGLHFTTDIPEQMIVTFTHASHANRADGSLSIVFVDQCLYSLGSNHSVIPTGGLSLQRR